MRGQVGERIARGIVGAADAGVKRERDDHVEGKRGQMQRIDPGHPAPQEASRRRRVVDAVQILPRDDEAGDREEQIDEQVEVPGMVDHEPTGGPVLEVVRIVQNDDRAGCDDPQPVQMSCGARGLLQGKRVRTLTIERTGAHEVAVVACGRMAVRVPARSAIRPMTASRSPPASAFQRFRFCSASAA